MNNSAVQDHYLIELVVSLVPSRCGLALTRCGCCRIAKTFCFSNRGHGLYLASPTEIQKFTIDAEFW